MNTKDITIVICCAGMGTRLGIGTTKALVNIQGKPLIIRQLELLKEYDDVRIVVGFQAERLIEVITEYRKDIMIVFNHDYMNTGVAASISKGMINCRKYVVSIDGDVLVNPEDFSLIMNYPSSCICGTNPISDESIYINVDDNGQVCSFSDERTDIEWCGINKFESSKVVKFEGRVTEMLTPLLPLPLLNIRAREVDTMEDYDKMITWVKNEYSE